MEALNWFLFFLEENKSFSALLREREIEEAEVLSVNMGKLKKRVKKPAPGQKARDDDEHRPARPAGNPSDSGKGKTPRSDAKPSSPRSRPEKSAPKKSGK